jgi:hypothetical protein
MMRTKNDEEQVDSHELAAAARADEDDDEDHTRLCPLPPGTQQRPAPAGAASQPSATEHLFTGPDAVAHRAALAAARGRGRGRGRGGTWGRGRAVATPIALSPPQISQAGRERQKRHKGMHED